MSNEKSLISKPHKKVLISNDFREVLLTQNNSIIEQRILMMILSALKDEQSNFINEKTSFNEGKEKQLSFDVYFQGWANQSVVNIIIPLSQLNPDRVMKNAKIQEALIKMTNLSWMRLKDESINGYNAVPFIMEPSWNRSHIFFKMDNAVIKNLLNMSQYFQLIKELPYKTSSANTMKFLLWIMKFKKFGRKTIDYSQLLNELYIYQKKYDGRSRFEKDFLIYVIADLDSFNDLSFSYSYLEDKYSFVIYNTRKSVGINEEFISLEKFKIDRSLKYFKKIRELDDSHVNVLKKLYQVRGHKELSKKINSKIEVHLKGVDYIKAILNLLEEEE